MMLKRSSHHIFFILLLACIASPGLSRAADPLPSWNEGDTKQAIVSFVTKTTGEGSPDFVPAGQRIATFDNDGTLWAEKPIYFQLLYAIDKVKQMAPQHPEWKQKEPFASIIKGDTKKALEGGEPALMQLIAATHTGMTGEEFQDSVKQWLATARHPETNKPYTEMIYQPMLELLNYLRANGYKTFIVSGGGIDFLRAFAESTYGIPPEQVVGSSLKAKYEERDGKPVIVKLPEVNLIDDKAGKPVGIYQHIGRRPVFAAGNSDGDYEMLQWATAGEGPHFGLLVHHTDGKRAWAYDRKSHVGQLNKALDAAPKAGWTVVDMKDDWKVIFPWGNR
ncbi:haloacid dehalogenase-like hydrolase [Microbulbifer aggregans]|uniref:phosphoserine phosphatase n=1 Tax=Microbulbifer aggregans TaxID=1769779 RepID=A0A1C9WAL2_9GAMM|nr:HAD family hydrolase [Microbulbifer aggregans]AOS98143.1 haloacid dehalogenase-like hydrolase [Microbulbifer aggregans]